jgi:hypothetical protein
VVSASAPASTYSPRKFGSVVVVVPGGRDEDVVEGSGSVDEVVVDDGEVLDVVGVTVVEVGYPRVVDVVITGSQAATPLRRHARYSSLRHRRAALLGLPVLLAAAQLSTAATHARLQTRMRSALATDGSPNDRAIPTRSITANGFIWSSSMAV